jgi:Reeler domain
MMFSSSFCKANVFLLVLSSSWVSMHALPTGAPLCIVGASAPGEPHREDDRNPQTGPLNTAGFIVKVGNEMLDTAATITLRAYQDYVVTLTSVDGQKEFRGALMILSKPGVPTLGLFKLQPEQESKLKVSDICEDYYRSGVTHIDSDLKTSVEATVKFDENYDEIFLDVNVVVINRQISEGSEGGSSFYWDQFKLKVEGATPAPSQAPAPKCGLFRLGIFCPFTLCGFLGQLLFGSVGCQ